MKKAWWMGIFIVIVCIPSALLAQGFQQFIDRFAPRIEARDLRVTHLQIVPDPVHRGDPMRFQLTISNASNRSGRVNVVIKDSDEIISQAYDITIRPGINRVDFPQANYRFERNDHCFTVDLDVEGNRSPIDLSEEYCVRRTNAGWTLASGPRLFVEDLNMFPDPAQPGQEIRFVVRLRNDGKPIRADVRLQDKDEVVAQMNDFSLSRGRSEIQFPFTQYRFTSFDQCFTVVADIERTRYPIDAARQFCAKPVGWTLRETGHHDKAAEPEQQYRHPR